MTVGLGRTKAAGEPLLSSRHTVDYLPPPSLQTQSPDSEDVLTLPGAGSSRLQKKKRRCETMVVVGGVFMPEPCSLISYGRDYSDINVHFKPYKFPKEVWVLHGSSEWAPEVLL